MASSNFLMPKTDLTTRLCFVFFDGQRALEAYRAAKKAIELNGSSQNSSKRSRKKRKSTPILDNDGKLTDDFVREYCKPTVEGVESIKKWCLSL